MNIIACCVHSFYLPFSFLKTLRTYVQNERNEKARKPKVTYVCRFKFFRFILCGYNNSSLFQPVFPEMANGGEEEKEWKERKISGKY